MAITGLYATDDFGTDQRPKDWLSGLLRLYPNGKAPLVALSSMMKSRTVEDPEFNWWEKEVQDRKIEVNEDLDTSETAVTVLAASGGQGGALSVKIGDVLWSPQSDELMRVSANPTTDVTLTVTRGFGGTTAAALDYNGAGEDPNIYVVGNAMEEGSAAPKGISFNPTKRNNYTQIYRHALEITRTAAGTRLRTGDQVKEARRECLELHTMDMERSWWFGRKSEDLTGSQPRRTTDGVYQQIKRANSSNILTATAAGMDLEELEEMCYNFFLFGSQEKMAFCGNRALLTINQLLRKNADANFSISSPTKEFGMSVTKFVTPYGELVFKTHPLFNLMRGGTTASSAYHGVESWMFVLDMAELKKVNFKNGSTRYQPKIETPGLDGMKSAYLTECALQLSQSKVHWVVKDVVKAATDN